MTLRADEIKRAREAASVELGVPETHWLVRRYALFNVNRN
jgi:hypothetical protein